MNNWKPTSGILFVFTLTILIPQLENLAQRGSASGAQLNPCIHPASGPVAASVGPTVCVSWRQTESRPLAGEGNLPRQHLSTCRWPKLVLPLGRDEAAGMESGAFSPQLPPAPPQPPAPTGCMCFTILTCLCHCVFAALGFCQALFTCITVTLTLTPASGMWLPHKATVTVRELNLRPQVPFNS